MLFLFVESEKQVIVIRANFASQKLWLLLLISHWMCCTDFSGEVFEGARQPHQVYVDFEVFFTFQF